MERVKVSTYTADPKPARRGPERRGVREAVRLRHHDALRQERTWRRQRDRRATPRGRRRQTVGLRPRALRRRPDRDVRRRSRQRRLHPRRRLHQEGDRQGLRRRPGDPEPPDQARRARRADPGGHPAWSRPSGNGRRACKTTATKTSPRPDEVDTSCTASSKRSSVRPRAPSRTTTGRPAEALQGEEIALVEADVKCEGKHIDGRRAEGARGLRGHRSGSRTPT